MRQWHVNPKLLCRKHLLGEHLEHHMFVGSINKGIDVTGYIRDGLLDIITLHDRHDALVAEMKARGYNHNSPLPDLNHSELQKYLGDNYFNNMNIPANIDDLCNRCEECRERFEENGLLERAS